MQCFAPGSFTPYGDPSGAFLHKSHGLAATFLEGNNTFLPDPADSYAAKTSSSTAAHPFRSPVAPVMLNAIDEVLELLRKAVIPELRSLRR